jgi:hypothetical protein
MAKCTDQVVGNILAGWRYDISGITPEMRSDYEAHFAECEHCRGRRKWHRTIDISLIVLASVSIVVFMLAFLVIRHWGPRHAIVLELGALGGMALSALIFLGVVIATPAPYVVLGAAITGARLVHDKLPDKVKERIPEELRAKISGPPQE